MGFNQDRGGTKGLYLSPFESLFCRIFNQLTPGGLHSSVLKQEVVLEPELPPALSESHSVS